jgi:hypothetical protein
MPTKRFMLMLVVLAAVPPTSSAAEPFQTSQPSQVEPSVNATQTPAEGVRSEVKALNTVTSTAAGPARAVEDAAGTYRPSQPGEGEAKPGR